MANEQLAGPGLTAPATGGAGGNTQGANVSFTRSSMMYDSPFLDMTSTFLPKSIKGILRFVASYVMGDGLVAQCVTKMSEYPITKLLYNDETKSSLKDDQTIDKWKFIMEKKLKILKSLKQSGMDYYAYGNSIVSINYPFIRLLKCPRCGKERSAAGLEHKFRSFEFYANCATEKCGYRGKMVARDVNTTEIEKIKVVHWDLLYLDIKYNSITGDHFYFYTIPVDLSAAIRRGDMDIIGSTRLEVIEAVRTRKQLKLMADNVYHLKRPAPQYLVPSERGWGIPVIMPVMKDIFHCKVLKKGNEMIAFDHIVPLRLLYPMGTGDVSPHATINLSTWKTKIEDEIRKWKSDPNYICIVPLPLGMQSFSGEAKILSVAPEIRATEDVIITGIGIIPEIIRGGATWSGSNVSLRVVENTFLNHRSDMQDLLDFIVDKVQKLLKMPKITVKMSDFKMADDLEKKKIMIDVSRGSTSDALISKKTTIKELGFDPDEEFNNQAEELKKRVELITQEAEGQAEAQGAALLVSAGYQADAQIDQQYRTEMRQRESQAKREEANQIQSEENAIGVEQDVAALASKKGIPPGSISIQNLILVLTQRFARLVKFDPEEFKIRMLAMKNSSPGLYQEVYNNLKEMNLIIADTTPDIAVAQQYTPGELPSYSQGDNSAAEPPTAAEFGADPSANGQLSEGYSGPLPEARPPRAANAQI